MLLRRGEGNFGSLEVSLYMARGIGRKQNHTDWNRGAAGEGEGDDRVSGCKERMERAGLEGVNDKE